MAEEITPITFNFDCGVVKIDVDNANDYRAYSLTLRERLALCKEATSSSTAEEAVKSQEKANILECIVAKTNTLPPNKFDPKGRECKGIRTFNISNVPYIVIYPKDESVDTWTEELEVNLQELNEITALIQCLNPGFEVELEVIEREIATINFDVKTRKRVKVVENILRIQALETSIKNWLNLFSEKCLSMKLVADPSTEGLWAAIDSQEEQENNVVVPIRHSLGFNSRTIRLINQMMFSKDIEERACAKIDLTSLLSPEKASQVFKEPDVVLAIAFAESRLTDQEILNFMFPKYKDKIEQRCISCNSTVKTGVLMYHTKCTVIEWLIKYQAFKYDVDQGALVSIQRRLIPKETRYKIIQLLRYHHMLNNDIVVKNQDGTTIWKRQPDGTLKKDQLRSIRPEDQIGSSPWRRANGIN